MVRALELERFHRYRPTVLVQEIERAESPEEAGKLNLKETMMPLVGFGLYSLHHQMPHAHSMERT